MQLWRLHCGDTTVEGWNNRLPCFFAGRDAQTKDRVSLDRRQAASNELPRSTLDSLAVLFAQTLLLR
jgi:hypothetical protein